VRFEVWHPDAAAPAAAGNAESLVLAVELGGRRFLFSGDIASAEETRLAARAAAEPAAVLKVAHHGAAGSSAAAFVAPLRPRLAVVSVGGRNSYGHPAPAALARLAAGGARLLRTDRDGEVALVRRGAGPWRLELPGSPRRIRPQG